MTYRLNIYACHFNFFLSYHTHSPFTSSSITDHQTIMNQSDQENEEMHSYFDNQSPGLFNDEDLTPMCQPRQQQKQHSDNSSLLTRIRQNFSVSHFLGYHNRAPGDGSDDEIVSTPVSSEESSTSTRRFSSIKNVFNSSHSDAHSRSNTSNSTCSVSSASSHSASKKQSSLYACSTQTSLPETLGTFSSQLDSPALTMSSLPDDTPPVTPCLPAGEASHSDIVVDPDNEHKREASIEIRDDEYRHDESKKGKEPAPPFVRAQNGLGMNIRCALNALDLIAI